MWVYGPTGGDSQLLNGAAEIPHVVQIGCIPTTTIPEAKIWNSENDFVPF